MKALPLVFAATLLLAATPFTRGDDSVSRPSAADAPAESPQTSRTSLRVAITRHLDLLLGRDGTARFLKGKTADGQEAFAFYLLYELTGNPAYRQAAVRLVDHVLQEMRAMKFGVLPIKEKDKPGGEKIIGGGPPALGFYASRAAYVLYREGGRDEDLKYLAGVLDRYPWNEDGWWAATIDVKTGEPKEPLAKPSIINKSASLAMAAGLLSRFVRASAPELAARLQHKTDRCVYDRILPAQEADGFWHYSFSGNDPKEKDVLGYFLLTTNVLLDLQQFNEAYRETRLHAALQRAQAFALRCVAPMTDPYPGPAPRPHATPGTPARYTMPDDVKRGFSLGRILLAAGATTEGWKILDTAVRHFPSGNAGQDGAHAAEPAALILVHSP